MHDPMIMAFEIRSPIKHKSQMFPEGYRKPLFTIWHVDPETDGTDDSCGWFMRSRHGDKTVLEKIIKRFESDWDRTFTSESNHTYDCGYFKPNGLPHLSVTGITLNLFFLTALEMFGSRDKASKWVQKHLFEIMLFSENPIDSLNDGFTRKFAIGCNEPYTKRAREDRIRSTASCIYSWVLRENRPWYKHPKFHFWHWKIQWHWWQKFHRWAFEKCSKCGKRYSKWGDTNVISDWHGTRHWHGACDTINKN